MCITRRHNARSAFTMVELLIVIAIIAVMAALTTAAVMRFWGTGPRLATSSGLSTIKGHFDKQWNAVRTKANNDVLPSNFLGFAQWYSSKWAIPIQNDADPRIRQVYIELMLAQAFPINYQEARDPTNGYPSPPSSNWAQPHGPYMKYFQSLGISTKNPPSPADLDSLEVQEGVCLYMALERGPQNNNVNSDGLGSTAANQLNLQTGKRAWACVDGWGRPLLFSRYTRKDPTNADSVGDSKAVPPIPANPTILQPVIMSMGQDGKAGVDMTLTMLTLSGQPRVLAPDSQYAYDNLYTQNSWDQFFILKR